MRDGRPRRRCWRRFLTEGLRREARLLRRARMRAAGGGEDCTRRGGSQASRNTHTEDPTEAPSPSADAAVASGEEMREEEAEGTRDSTQRRDGWAAKIRVADDASARGE
ncbi:hypothetical protein BESB_066630 [Besnoitia besnoiti]|uniref:Uncharacterized protein n=1 Tax=Besnoitia besnoiti TaxID=94643 RepID=A0A2A9MGT0_BESBE|nr:hypothetical protein BESB_066630 [Besnoitia besnoiti]PFH34630.1 hypothetical protein BESB_066630 [Besnoitia besnoiti]